MGGGSVFLDALTWPEAEPILRADPLVVVPIGAGAKEHGPHLPLGTDRIMAEYLTRRLAERVPVVVLPTVTYGYYPHFAAFPGSLHLEAATFGAMVREIILSMARHGPRRYLILNTGVSTFPVLEVVARDLDRVYRLLVGVTRIGELGKRQTAALLEQRKGSHADEHETSIMMAIAPEVVREHLRTAEVPDRADAPAVFVPSAYHRDSGPGYSATGVYGDATLATRAKGEALVEAMIDDLAEAAERLRTAPAPTPRPGIPW